MPADIEHVTHEDPDVRTWRVLLLVFGFVGFVILLGGGLNLYFRAITANEPLSTPLRRFPAPELQPNPRGDWASFHRAQSAGLEGYGWVDRKNGLVHIPIERAMALVVARGTQAYAPVAGTPPYVTATGAPLDGAPRATPQPMAAPYGEVR